MFRENKKTLSELPVGIIDKILRRLDLRDALNLMATNDVFNKFMKNYGPYWRQYGADNYVNFLQKIKKVPEEYHFLIINRTLTLDGAKQADEILGSHFEPGVSKVNQRLEVMFKIAPALQEYLQFVEGEFERPEQIIKYNPQPGVEQIQAFFSRVIILLLADKLLTTEDIFELPLPVGHVMSIEVNALYALRENLLDKRELMNSNISVDVFRMLLTDKGLQAMRDGRLTFHDAEQAESAEALKKLIDVKCSESEVVEKTKVLMQGKRDEVAKISVLPVEMLEEIAVRAKTSDTHGADNARDLATKTRVAEESKRKRTKDDVADDPQGKSRNRLK